MNMKNKLKLTISVVLMGCFLTSFSFNSNGSSLEGNVNGNAKPSICLNENMVTELYTVKKGDTLLEIAEEYVEKNTYGARNIYEFAEGIKEANSELFFMHSGNLIEGTTIKINYFVKNK